MFLQTECKKKELLIQSNYTDTSPRLNFFLMVIKVVEKLLPSMTHFHLHSSSCQEDDNSNACTHEKRELFLCRTEVG